MGHNTVSDVAPPIARNSLHSRGRIKPSPKSINNELEIRGEIEERGLVDLPRVGAFENLHRQRDLGVDLRGNVPDSDVNEVKGRKGHFRDSVIAERGSHCGQRMDRRIEQ